MGGAIFASVWTPNNREWSLLVWATIVLVTLIVYRGTRPSFLSILRQLFNWRILVPALGFIGWTLLLIWLGRRLGVWKDFLVRDTITWFFFTAVALLFNFDKAAKEEHIFAAVSFRRSD